MTDAIVIGIIHLSIVISIAYAMKRKKDGKSGCGCDCSACDSSESCAPVKEK